LRLCPAVVSACPAFVPVAWLLSRTKSMGYVVCLSKRGRVWWFRCCFPVPLILQARNHQKSPLSWDGFGKAQAKGCLVSSLNLFLLGGVHAWRCSGGGAERNFAADVCPDASCIVQQTQGRACRSGGMRRGGVRNSPVRHCRPIEGLAQDRRAAEGRCPNVFMSAVAPAAPVLFWL